MLPSSLPVPWLTPQEGAKVQVASICILDLHGITVAPLTTMVGLESISCAPRYAVLDASRVPASPAVFVTECQTKSRFGAWFTTLGFSAPHPHVEAVINHRADERCCVSTVHLTDSFVPRRFALPQHSPRSYLRLPRSSQIPLRRVSAVAVNRGMDRV